MNDIALGIAHITDWQGYDHALPPWHSSRGMTFVMPA